MKNKRLITDPKTALKKSIEMWEWLVEHPDKDKIDFFIEKNLFDEDRPWADCYLCEYCNTIVEEHTHCELCPVDWINNGKYNIRYRCEKTGSPYKNWKNSWDSWGDADRTKYAKEVAELLKKSLNNLDKWKKEWYNKLENTGETE